MSVNLKFNTRLSCDLAIALLGTNPRGPQRHTLECLLQLRCSHEPKLNFCQQGKVQVNQVYPCYGILGRSFVNVGNK